MGVRHARACVRDCSNSDVYNSLEIHHYVDAVEADLSALVVVEGRPAAVEFRVVDWLFRSVRGNTLTHHALMCEVEAVLASAPDAASGWDCRVRQRWRCHGYSKWLGLV